MTIGEIFATEKTVEAFNIYIGENKILNEVPYKCLSTTLRHYTDVEYFIKGSAYCYDIYIKKEGL